MSKPAPQGRVIKKSKSRDPSLTERVEKAITETREAIARADQAIARTRQTLQKAEELHYRMGAQRERDAERPHPTYQLPRPQAPRHQPSARDRAHRRATYKKNESEEV
jgi:hypothetical protein